MKTLLPILALAYTTTLVAQKDPNNFHLDKEFKVSATGTIKLNASDAKVTITGSTRETAHVKIDREVTTKGWVFGKEAFDVDIQEEAGGLTIKEKPHSISGIVGYYSERYSILLELPSNVSLTVRGDDGNYKVKNINGAISFELDDADVELTDCGGNSFYFNMDDGNVNMNQGKGKLEIKGDDAHIKIMNGSFSAIEASADDGSLSIETSLTDNGTYHIRSEDGPVTFSVIGGGGKIEVRHDDGHVSADNQFELTKSTEDEKLYTLAQGTANVTIRTEDARVKLTSR